MPRFVFKYQTLLDLKIQIEDSLKNDLGKATRRLEEEKLILSRIEAKKEDYIERFGQKINQGLLVNIIKEYGVYVSFLKHEIEIQEQNISLAQKNVDEYREKLIKAAQEREILNKLKEKEYAEYLKEQNKVEQKSYDEIVSFNYSKC